MKKKLQILSDFDGTITQRDTVDILLSELAHPSWEEIEQEWEQGKIGSRECMARQIPLIQGGWPAVKDILDSLKIDPHFKEFVSWCKERAIPVVVVSDGLDKVIKYLLSRHEILVDKVHANHLLENPDGSLKLEFAKTFRLSGCQSGVCKCQIAANLPYDTLSVVIGDGRSDFCWAKEAQLLFAKHKLISHCQENKIAHNTFETFADVHQAISAYSQGLNIELNFHVPFSAALTGAALAPNSN